MLHRVGDAAAAAQRHRAQLRFYRQAVAVLTGLDPESVRAELVLTRLRIKI